MKNQGMNPILPLDAYIPDGEPHVFGDRLYLFGSHDVEGGTRALDFLGELLQALRGERALWQDAVQAAKHPDAKSVGLAAEPIPSGYIARWY